MRRLIVTTDDSGSGRLKQAFPEARVQCAMHRLIRDPVPETPDMWSLFAERARLHASDPSQSGCWDYYDETGIADWYDQLGREWLQWDVVEFWADPDPNAILILLQFLHWVAEHPDLDTGNLCFTVASGMLGDAHPDRLAHIASPLVPIVRDALPLAARVWTAFRQRTPAPLAALSDLDWSELRSLRPIVERLLTELPAHDTELGACEARVLNLVRSGVADPRKIFGHFVGLGRGRSLTMFEFGKVLDDFARGPEPILLGLREGPFDLALYDDRDKLKSYRESRLTLSAAGRALVNGDGSLTQFARLNRWWGGVHLTGANCWRWNARERRLLPPD